MLFILNIELEWESDISEKLNKFSNMRNTAYNRLDSKSVSNNKFAKQSLIRDILIKYPFEL